MTEPPQQTPALATTSDSDQLQFQRRLLVALKSLTTEYINTKKHLDSGGFGDLGVASSLATAATPVNYTLGLRSLKNQLKFFKDEMQDMLVKNYFPARRAGGVNKQFVMNFIDGQVEKLRGAVADLQVSVPETELKTGLGDFYALHKELPTLASTDLLRYFELNFALRFDTKDE